MTRASPLHALNNTTGLAPDVGAIEAADFRLVADSAESELLKWLPKASCNAANEATCAHGEEATRRGGERRCGGIRHEGTSVGTLWVPFFVWGPLSMGRVGQQYTPCVPHLVFPTPGGPTRQRIGLAASGFLNRTAICSKILCFTFRRPDGGNRQGRNGSCTKMWERPKVRCGCQDLT